MGEKRRMFHELMGDISNLTVRELQQPLHEIATGTSVFGPAGEWNDWYHYLLGQLLPRSHEDNFFSSLLESLIAGFFALYPNGVDRPPYEQFHSDILSTLGRCMMDPRCWNGDDIVVGSMLHRSNDNPAGLWFWEDASGDFSASMFLCLKYLPPSLVPGWFASALAIPSPHWRAQVLVWLVGANEILRGLVRWPSELQIETHPSIRWEDSHCLDPELASSGEPVVALGEHFLPSPSREGALEVARRYFTEDAYIAWLESISQVPYLEAELAAIPSTFESMYVQRGEA